MATKIPVIRVKLGHDSAISFIRVPKRPFQMSQGPYRRVSRSNGVEPQG